MARKESMCHQLFILFLSYLLSVATGYSRISRRDIKEIWEYDVPCPNSCSNLMYPDTLEYNFCECGVHCKKYRTCCLNSPHRHLQDADASTKQVECYKTQGSVYYYFTVTTCDPEWSGDVNIKSLCEDESRSWRDPIMQTPATNSRSGMVYKNYFCAMCNDDLKDLSLWNIRITKAGIVSSDTVTDTEEGYRIMQAVVEGYDLDEKEDKLKEMVYNEARNKWGFFSEAVSEIFEPVTIEFEEPYNLYLSRKCNPSVVSDCHANWTDEVVRNKCHSYMAAGWSNDNYLYRNIDCAICNYASVDKFSCWSGGSFGRGGGPISFSLLLDVNPKDGRFVGRASRCKDGESYDEFHKKCRTLVCALPGYTMVNNKCKKG